MKYQCEHCGKIYDLMADATECERSHETIDVWSCSLVFTPGGGWRFIKSRVGGWAPNEPLPDCAAVHLATNNDSLFRVWKFEVGDHRSTEKKARAALTAYAEDWLRTAMRKFPRNWRKHGKSKKNGLKETIDDNAGKR